MALRTNGSRPAEAPAAYITARDRADGGNIDREAALHKRRKDAMVSLLSEFEREIEPHVQPGHEQAVEHFKRSCREKLNGLTFMATELMRLRQGERFNEHAADLAEAVDN